MNRRRLLLAAALAPFASTALRAQSPPPEAAAIPPALVEKLLKLIAGLGVDTNLPAAIAGALGLGVAGQPWPDRQFTVQSEQDGAHHAVAIHRGADLDMVYSVNGAAAVSIYRVRRDGTLVAATAYFPDTGLTADLLRGQSLSDLTAEGHFWAMHVEALMGQL